MIRIFLLFIYVALFFPSCAVSQDKSKVVKDDSPCKNCLQADYVMGKFDPSKHPDFIEIPVRYADREGRFLRRDVMDAFVKMFEAARTGGITLQIRSATRNFEAQKKIWEDKWFGRRILEDGTNAMKDIPDEKTRALKILEYSSMPGTSRHHWGTDIDLNAFTNDYFESGEGLKIYTWLQENARLYGFCQTYTSFDTQRPTGYQPEKWHWSYVPVSAGLTEWAGKNLDDVMISGFAGSHTAKEIHIVEKYVLGIHPQCTGIPEK